MDLIITILPVVTKDLAHLSPVHALQFFIAMQVQHSTTRRPMVEFYLLTFPRFPSRKKEHKSYFGKNRTHDFRTSKCAGYLLDHSGDEGSYLLTRYHQYSTNKLTASQGLVVSLLYNY